MMFTVKGPRVLIRPQALPEQTEDGRLHLVHDQSRSAVLGTVIAVGEGAAFATRAIAAALDTVRERLVAQGLDPGALFDGVYAPRERLVNVGDTVIFSPHAGTELIFERDVLIAMQEDDVLAVIRE